MRQTKRGAGARTQLRRVDCEKVVGPWGALSVALTRPCKNPSDGGGHYEEVGGGVVRIFTDVSAQEGEGVRLHSLCRPISRRFCEQSLECWPFEHS